MPHGRLWMMRTLLSVLALAVVLAAGGCVPRIGQGSAQASGGTSRSAELATLRVHNGTDSELVIGYRAAARRATEVIVGKVAPDAQVTVAPVPAGEPIALIATRQDGRVLRLGMRTFEPNEEWLWVIPMDASFEPAGAQP